MSRDDRYRVGIYADWHNPESIPNYKAKIVNGTTFIMLPQYPSPNHRFIIKDFIEVDNKDDIVNKNEFWVDYKEGFVYFHPSLQDTWITIKEFYGIGINRIDAKRIVTKLDASGNVVQVLQDIIDAYKEIFEALAQAIQLVKDVQDTLEVLESTQNPSFTISKGEWTSYVENSITKYKTTINHKLLSKNLQITAIDMKTDMNMGSPPYKVIDFNNIEVYSFEDVTIKYIVSAGYYNGVMDNDRTNEVLTELYDARLGEPTLKDKIIDIDNNIEELLDMNNSLFELKALFKYGLKPDANYYSNGHWYTDSSRSQLATDNSVALQKYINDIIKDGGGTVYIPKGRYYIANPVYINPNITMPIKLTGELICRNIPPALFENTSIVMNRNFGSIFICDTPEVFRVNTNSSGRQNLKGSSPSANFDAFQVENLGFLANKNSSGNYIESTAFILHGVRMKARNITQRGMSRLFYFPSKDSNNFVNYSDFVEIDGVYSKELQYGLIELSRADTCEIKNIHSESPAIKSDFMIKLNECTGFNINNISSSIHKAHENNVTLDGYTHNGLSATSETNPILQMYNSTVTLKNIRNWVGVSKKNCDVLIEGSYNVSKLEISNVTCKIRTTKNFLESQERLLAIKGCQYIKQNCLKYDDLKKLKVISTKNSDGTYSYSIQTYNGEVIDVYGKAKWENGLLLPNNSPFTKMAKTYDRLKTTGYQITYLPVVTTEDINYCKISFYDFNGTRITNQDEKCGVLINCI